MTGNSYEETFYCNRKGAAYYRGSYRYLVHRYDAGVERRNHYGRVLLWRNLCRLLVGTLRHRGQAYTLEYKAGRALYAPCCVKK